MDEPWVDTHAIRVGGLGSKKPQAEAYLKTLLDKMKDVLQGYQPSIEYLGRRVERLIKLTFKDRSQQLAAYDSVVGDFINQKEKVYQIPMTFHGLRKPPDLNASRDARITLRGEGIHVDAEDQPFEEFQVSGGQAAQRGHETMTACA